MSTQCVAFGEMTNTPSGFPISSSTIPSAVIANNPSKPLQLRHKISYRTIAQNIDSSESAPSLHSSIYDARKWSSIEENIQPHGVEPPEGPERGTENGYEIDQSLENTSNEYYTAEIPVRSRSIRSQWKYGTPLETIKEQQSFATLRPTKSLEFDGQRLQYDGTAIARKKKSFSSNDLQEFHAQKKPLARQVSKSLFEVVVYTKPKVPSHDPPERPPTPPGMPSWTASQVAYARTQNSNPAHTRPSWRRRARSRFRTTLSRSRLGRHGITTPRRVPRFRSPPSGHGTVSSLQNHPFHQQDTSPKQPPAEPSTSQSQRGPAAETTLPSQRSRVHFLNTVQSGDTTVPFASPAASATCLHAHHRRKQENIPLLSLATTPRVPPSADTQAFLEHLDTTHVRGGYCWRCTWDRVKELFCLWCCRYDDHHDNASQSGNGLATRFAGARRMDREGSYCAGI